MAMPISIPKLSIDDLEHFPSDGNRYELLDGFLLVTPAPGAPHEIVVARLSRILGQYLAPDNREIALVFTHGAIQRLPGTHLEPDLLVTRVAAGPIPTSWREMQPAWLVVEVLSSSSRRYDLNYKQPVYLQLGAREVWIVDPIGKDVRVFTNDRRHTLGRDDVLRWHPSEMADALDIDLKTIFRDFP